MFKKLRKNLFDFNLLELKKKHYYLVVLKNQDDVKDFGEALNDFLGEETDRPRVLVVSSEELNGMRVIEIG